MNPYAETAIEHIRTATAQLADLALRIEAAPPPVAAAFAESLHATLEALDPLERCVSPRSKVGKALASYREQLEDLRVKATLRAFDGLDPQTRNELRIKALLTLNGGTPWQNVN